MILEIPENELEVSFVRSSGPGGQHVNKTSTKAQVSWNIKDSSAFNDKQKERIIAKYHTETLQTSNQETRSQPENKRRAIKKLNDLVESALWEEKKRIPTKPTYGSQIQRLLQKRHRSVIKSLRKKPDLGDES